MNAFETLVTEDRRLTLLRGLQGAAQWRANAHLLNSFCEHFGHSVSRDRLAADLAWLSEQGLVLLEHPGDVTVVTLTQRGYDVADGRARCPGVKVPTPGI